MRVLVTGAGGFLGFAITRALMLRGDQVVAVNRSHYPKLSAIGAQQILGDIAEPSVLNRAAEACDAIMHVAALPGHWGRYEDYYRANVLGTERVLEACRLHHIGKLVYTSTPSVAHAGGDLAGVDENAPIPTHFRAHYPATKAIAEAAVLAANGASLATCALRPHLIWGPGDNHLLPRLIARARAGKLKFVGKSQLIDTIFIDNAVQAHLLALDQLGPGAACAGKAYFLSNDEPIALDVMVNKLLACVDIAPVNRRVPYPIAYAVGALLELAYTLLPIKGEPIMTRFLAEQLSTAHWYDISAIKRDLGYRAQVSVEAGLQILRARIESPLRG
jgi:2-alkyl-3-oxoalkanoate reductase